MVDPAGGTSGSISQMIWAGFYAETKSSLVVMTKDPAAKRNGYTARSFLQLLQDNLPQHAQQVSPSSTTMRLFTPQIIVREWLENNGFIVIDWPPLFTDMNPIENLMFYLKELVDEIHPDLVHAYGGAETIQEMIGEAAEQTWNVMDWSMFEAVIDSMPRRSSGITQCTGVVYQILSDSEVPIASK